MPGEVWYRDGETMRGFGLARPPKSIAALRFAGRPFDWFKTRKLHMSDVAERVKKIVVEHLGVEQDKVVDLSLIHI